MLKKIFTPYLRYAVIASTMATLAFVLGSHIPHVSASIAGITVLVAIRPTFHASIKEGFYQILAIIVGAGLALGISVIIGKFSPFTLVVALLACFLLSHFASLGEGGAVSIGISIILVLGPGFDKNLIETRFLGILVGSVFAIFGSFWTKPGTPTQRALQDIVTESGSISELLTEMGLALANPSQAINDGITGIWLEEAKRIQVKVNEIRKDAEDVRDSHRWSPLINKKEAEAVLSQIKITQAILTTVLNIARDLRAVAHHDQDLPEEVAQHLSIAILATADVVAEQSERAASNPAQKLDANTDGVRTREEAQEQALLHLREQEDDRALVIGGSVLQDTQKINSILTKN